VLRYEDAPLPQLRAREALIRVRACALNHLDVWVRMGARGWAIPLPHILGSDVAGEVVAVGSEVEPSPGLANVRPGLECFVHPGVPGGPSPERLRGDDNVAADYTILGQLRDGGYAQYVAVPAENVLLKPARLAWEEAAAFPLTFLTAWHMLGRRRADLRSGETVLVVGASSGVGTAAIQVAKARGCRVIATAGGADKLAFARGLGADEAIDHYARKDEIHKAVYELTGGQGVDVVVEHVGAAVFMQCLKALKRGGRLVTCGTTTGGQFEVDMQMLYAKHLTVYGSFMGSMGEMHELLPLVDNGTLRPIVDRVFPLAQAAEAHRYLEASEQCGKVMLTVE
jgi:NADPH:quinone reductase-like Zn-dependent oxidoreductase